MTGPEVKPPPISVEEFFQLCKPTDVAKWLLRALDGDESLDPEEEKRIFFKNGVLVWALSDNFTVHRIWTAIEGRGTEDTELKPLERFLESRDIYLQEYWHRIKADDKHADMRNFCEELGTLSAYRNHLVNWFICRFNLVAALKISNARWSTGWLFAAFPILALIAIGIAALMAFGSVGMTVTALIALALFIVVAYVATRGDMGTATQILLPRLAVATALGYLFLAAAPHLVEVILTESYQTATALSALLLTLVTGYTVFHIWRRVHPALRFGSLALRVLPVLGLGSAYAALGLLLFLPLFSVNAFYGEPCPDQPWLNLILLGSVTFALGVVLELAWEEKPMTEPM